MSQRLASMIRNECFFVNAVSPLKTKRGVRSKAMKRAWQTRKRMRRSPSLEHTGPHMPRMKKETSISNLRSKAKALGVQGWNTYDREDLEFWINERMRAEALIRTRPIKGSG